MTDARRQRGFSVTLSFPGGDPEGVKIIEKSSWTGCGLVIPRLLFAETKVRPELERPGVYLLVGQPDDSALPKVYIGEGDPVRPRLEAHARDKEFWTHAVIFSSKDANLHKAYIQHLEARLVARAKAAKRCALANRNEPQPPSLSESDLMGIEGFLDDVLLCLALLGHRYFEAPAAETARGLEFHLRVKDVIARGYETTQGFVVAKGSRAVRSATDALDTYLKQMRTELIDQGVLGDAGPIYEVTQDYPFSSPSTAAGVLLGRSSNGRVEWKTADGRTLKSVQEAEVDG